MFTGESIEDFDNEENGENVDPNAAKEGETFPTRRVQLLELFLVLEEEQQREEWVAACKAMDHLRLGR